MKPEEIVINEDEPMKYTLNQAISCQGAPIEKVWEFLLKNNTAPFYASGKRMRDLEGQHNRNSDVKFHVREQFASLNLRDFLAIMEQQADFLAGFQVEQQRKQVFLVRDKIAALRKGQEELIRELTNGLTK